MTAVSPGEADPREPLVFLRDDFELVRKVAAAAYGDGIDWKARAEAAEARVRELESALGHFCPEREVSRG